MSVERASPRSLRVEVALIADERDPFGKIATEREMENPYSERPKAVLDVFEHESLAQVLDRAAGAMGFATSSAQYTGRFAHGYRSNRVLQA